MYDEQLDGLTPDDGLESSDPIETAEDDLGDGVPGF